MTASQLSGLSYHTTFVTIVANSSVGHPWVAYLIAASTCHDCGHIQVQKKKYSRSRISRAYATSGVSRGPTACWTQLRYRHARGAVNQSVKLINTLPHGGAMCDVPSCSNLMQKLIEGKGG